MTSHSILQDVGTEAAKAAPPVAVSGAVIAGMSPADWVTALTLAYLALQIGLLIPRYWQHLQRWIRARRERRE